MFYTHVVNVCSKMFHLLQRYVAFNYFHITSVSCFRGLFRESLEHSPGVVERGAASRGLADRARGAPGFLRTGRARAHPGSRIPLARRERERRRVRGKERRTWGEARRGVRGRDTHAGCDVVDGKGLQRYGDSAIHFLWSILLGHSVPFNKILSHRTSGRHQFPRIFSPAKCAGWKLAKFGMSSGRRLTRGL
jgi:hypothetical protein